MEEIIDLLREQNAAVNLPLELPTEEALVCIEEEILMPIPYDLRLFLLEVSDVIVGVIEPVTAADPRSHTYLSEVTSRAWEIGLSREYVPVCEYDGGYACIDQAGKIYFWDGNDVTKEWEDFWRWCRDVWILDE